jgi:CIC family chloride channel protein
MAAPRSAETLGRIGRPSWDEARRRLVLTAHLAWRRLGRENIRNSDVALIFIAALVGLLVAGAVAALQTGLQLLHVVAFAIPFDGHLSEGSALDWRRVLLVLPLGGLALGLATQLMRRWRPRDIIDAIEANALYGGRMSLIDSINLALLTLWSAGVGASVGMEAAFTQLGSGIASKIGRTVRLRRADLRTLVGCGAAAAIAAAFNAPLTGAFYAFELIMGSYTLATLAPITIAAVVATFVVRSVFGAEPIFTVAQISGAVGGRDYFLFMAMGAVAALLAIAVMQGVTIVEGWFRKLALPSWLRPAVGGLAIALIATAYPQVLGSGHGALVYTIGTGYDWTVLVGLLLAKMAASAISIGSGFRGGMFSSALFLGSLFGSLVASLLSFVVPSFQADLVAITLVGMGSLAAGVVGAPVTMILLVLESTSDFSVSIGVMVAVIVTTVCVRHWFGYSFATWRFHLRGVRVVSPHDIGWIEDLTVGKLMRGDTKLVPATMTLRELRERFPLGATKHLFVTRPDGYYLGFIDMVEAHSPDLDPRADEITAQDLLKSQEAVLLPNYNVRTALAMFVAQQLETLAVVSDLDSRRVVGFLTEAYALRRYNQALEQQRSVELGDSNLFSPARTE